MPNVIYSGYLDVATSSVPYAITDMNESFTNINDVKTKLLQFADGGVTSSSVFAQGDNSQYQSIPNPLKSDNLPSQSQIAFNADSGVGIGSNLFNGETAVLAPNGHFQTNNYMKIAAPNSASLYLHMRPNSDDIGMQGTRYNYNNGVLFEHSFNDSICPAKWWFDNDGIAYFAHGANFNVKLGFIPKNTRSFNYIGELLPLKLYAIQAVPSFASGTVKDAAGGAAPNRRIAAFKRSNYRLAGSTLSGSDGSYTMPLFAAKGEQLFFVCLDDDSAPDFEAQIYDRITVS